MASDKRNNSTEEEILQEHFDLDDDTIESLKRHYKLEDSDSVDLLRYVKGNRKTVPDYEYEPVQVSDA